MLVPNSKCYDVVKTQHNLLYVTLINYLLKMSAICQQAGVSGADSVAWK